MDYWMLFAKMKEIKYLRIYDLYIDLKDFGPILILRFLGFSLSEQFEYPTKKAAIHSQGSPYSSITWIYFT
jgi:hypothetical protein